MVNGFLSDVHKKHLDLWHKNLDSCSENISQKVVSQGCLGFFLMKFTHLKFFIERKNKGLNIVVFDLCNF